MARKITSLLTVSVIIVGLWILVWQPQEIASLGVRTALGILVVLALFRLPFEIGRATQVIRLHSQRESGERRKCQ